MVNGIFEPLLPTPKLNPQIKGNYSNLKLQYEVKISEK